MAERKWKRSDVALPVASSPVLYTGEGAFCGSVWDEDKQSRTVAERISFPFTRRDPLQGSFHENTNTTASFHGEIAH
ncbi:unnamed protein product [Boreogadus saida]